MLDLVKSHFSYLNLTESELFYNLIFFGLSVVLYIASDIFSYVLGNKSEVRIIVSRSFGLHSRSHLVLVDVSLRIFLLDRVRLKPITNWGCLFPKRCRTSLWGDVVVFLVLKLFDLAQDREVPIGGSWLSGLLFLW